MKKPGISNDEYLDRAADILCMFFRNHVGKERAITAEQISQITGIDERTQAEMMRPFEKRGLPVCSSAFGRYIAKNKEEWDEHLEKERTRGIKILHKWSRAKKNYILIHQPTLFDEGKKVA
jgi:hypothetical protein